MFNVITAGMCNFDQNLMKEQMDAAAEILATIIL
jgi:hypothetical protein